MVDPCPRRRVRHSAFGWGVSPIGCSDTFGNARRDLAVHYRPYMVFRTEHPPGGSIVSTVPTAVISKVRWAPNRPGEGRSIFNTFNNLTPSSRTCATRRVCEPCSGWNGSKVTHLYDDGFVGNNLRVDRVLLQEQPYRCAFFINEGTTMQINKLSSAALAASAAMLFSSGMATVSFAADAATVHCSGVNSCKGMSECKSAKNECKGMNSCKGMGWVSKSKADCAKDGGTAGK